MRVGVRNLQIEYNSPNGQVIPALGPLNFTIESGAFVSIVGPSGCGKSSLVRVLAGLQQPTTGEAFVGTEKITGPLDSVGLMFQESNLMPWRSVRDNIALPLELAGVSREKRYAAVEGLLPLLGLEGFAEAYPGGLSGGMAQRVAIGRVLIQNPAVMLLDEPLGALDAITREQISFDLLRVWAQEKQTAIMVTHDINEAVLLSDRVLVMSPRPGVIVADVAVDLPRPRRAETLYSDEFIEAAQTVRAALVGVA